MTDMARLLLMLGLAGTAVTFLGSAALWFLDEQRQIHRALRRVLKADPEAMLIARGRGRGAGFSFASGQAAVAWERGRWCLVYRIAELTGAELLVDGQVVARTFRGEARRPLDQVVSSAREVTLRLLFDDPRYPDFELDLWLAGDEARRDDWSPSAAIHEANRWIARADSIVRRPVAVKAAPPPAPTPVRRQPEPVADEAEPPWDDTEDVYN